MTLERFLNMFFRTPDRADPPMIYVFDSTSDAENWLDYLSGKEKMCDYKLRMILSTDCQPKSFLKDEWVNAEIDTFYAVEKDIIAVVVRRQS